MKSGSGHFGHGVHTGVGNEYSVPLYQVVGMLIKAPTTGSSIAAAAHDFNLDIEPGLLVVDGVVKEFAAQADVDLSSDGTAVPTGMDTGDSQIFSLIAYKSLADGDVRLVVVPGDVALDASVEPPSQATIEALFAEGTPWYELARTKIKRTGATTLTQTYDNRVRPLGVPDTHINLK